MEGTEEIANTIDETEVGTEAQADIEIGTDAVQDHQNVSPVKGEVEAEAKAGMRRKIRSLPTSREDDPAATLHQVTNPSNF